MPYQRPKQLRYIVVEGVIGVGKTTLVNGLAQRLNARTVFEVFEENPFLEGFYKDRARYAFPTEMFFLLSRFNQQEVFAQEDLLQSFSVSDYLFAKSRLFAEITLAPTEWVLFDRVFQILSRSVPRPDLVLFLHAPVEVLLERIAARGRSYEREIDATYLSSLEASYRTLLADYEEAPVLYVDTATTDFRRPEAIEELLERVMGNPRPSETTGTFRLEG